MDKVRTDTKPYAAKIAQQWVTRKRHYNTCYVRLWVVKRKYYD